MIENIILIASLILLIIVLLFLHVLMLRKVTTRRFWILSDYYWLVLSVIGLIGIAKDAQYSILSTTIPELQKDITHYYNDFCIEDMGSFITVFGDTSNIYKNPNISKERLASLALLGPSFDEEEKNANRNKQKKYVDAVKWARSFQKILIANNYEVTYHHNREVFDFIKERLKFERITVDKEFDSYGIEKIEDVKNGIQWTDEKLLLIEQYKKVDSTWEIVLKFLTPFLLAIALGIRLSKVTAQLMGLA